MNPVTLVATKQFVSAIASKHYVDSMRLCQLETGIRGNCGSISKWLVEKIHDLRNQIVRFDRVKDLLIKTQSEVLGSQSGIAELVKSLFRKPDRKRCCRMASKATDKTGNTTAIRAST